MLPKMKWFKCESCGAEEEELVDKSETEIPCTCGKMMALHPNKMKQIHNPGWEYDHNSWSQWNAGS